MKICLSLFAIILFLSSCKEDKKKYSLFEIKKSEYEKLHQIGPYIYENIFHYKNRRLANRYSFYKNNFIKEYAFLNNDSTFSYRILFDSVKIGKVKTVEGDPLTFMYFSLDNDNANVIIHGLACTLITDSIIISISDLRNGLSYKFGKLSFNTHYSRYIDHFSVKLPFYDSAFYDLQVNSYSKRNGDKIYNQVLQTQLDDSNLVVVTID